MIKTVKPPRLRNIQNIKGPLREGTLIHFSKKQWEKIIKGVPMGKAVPKYGVALECYPIPGGDVVGQPNCIQNPCEICRARVAGISPDGVLTFECLCKQDPNCPTEPVPPIITPQCSLAIDARRLRPIYCRNNGCRRTCRLTFVRQGTHWILTCHCA